MGVERWLDNLVSTALLVAVWIFVFRRRPLTRATNLIFLAALCLPFAEVLTVSAGMRLIATDWLALVLLAMLIARPRLQHMSRVQIVGVSVATCLAVLPVLALPFYDSAEVGAAALRLDPERASQPSEPIDLYLSYFVQALRWLQQCVLLVVIVAVVGTERRWRLLIAWTTVGSTINCLYGLYQASRDWLGWVDLPLLPFTYGRHFLSAAGYSRATGFMWEPTVFGSFTGLALLLVLFQLSVAPSARLWAALVIHVLALLLSFSATGFLAGVAGWVTFLLVAALGRGVRAPLRLAAATAAACAVVSLLSMSAPVRGRLKATVRKIVVSGAKAPSSRVERERAISVYLPDLLAAPNSLGLGIGQLTHVAGNVPLPLKVWAEQGLLGLVLLAGLCASIVSHTGPRLLMRSGESGAMTAALLIAMSVVVLVQSAAKVNFIFFFGGLLLAWPRKEQHTAEEGRPLADLCWREARPPGDSRCGS